MTRRPLGLPAALLLAAAFAGPHARPAAPSPRAGGEVAAGEFDLSDAADWMSRNAALLEGRKLAQIVLPGAHDAASYSLQRRSRACPSRINSSVALVAFLMAPRARAQEAPLSEQLAAGVRYVDLRVCAVRDGAGAPAFYTHHSLLGAPLDEVLDDLDRFSRAHPREIVILDFQHLNGFTAADRAALAAQIERRFDGRLLPTSESPALLTLREAWRRGISLIAMMAGAQPSAHVFDRSRILDSRWFRAKSVGALEQSAAAENLESARLHVLQWQLTPGPFEFLAHPTATLKEFAQGPNALILDGTLRRLLPVRSLNVVMTDDVVAVAASIARMNALR